jgi:hypothetical protein
VFCSDPTYTENNAGASNCARYAFPDVLNCEKLCLKYLMFKYQNDSAATNNAERYIVFVFRELSF